MRAVDFQSCPKTKAKTCECSKLESITESEETIKAICQLEHSPEDVTGFVKFKQTFGEETIIKGIVKGLTPGLHGFHIHEFGDLSDGCASAGGHYNPEGVEHGGLEHGHVGDLGNIKADDQGIARFQFKAPRVQLHDVVGRAIVIHADTDDLGQGGDEESTKTGNAGDRVACGVIRLKGSIEEDYNRALSDKHFNRNELPQIRRKHIKDSDFKYKEGKISIDKIKPVQSQRVDGLSKKAEDVFLKNADRPFIIDRKGYLINGHHRYDAAHILGIKRVPAIIIDADIEDVMKTFAHTTSDTKTMAENYFHDLLRSKMEEDLNERNLNPDVKDYVKGKKTKLIKVRVADLDDDAEDDRFGRVIDVDPDVGVDLDEPILLDVDGKTILDGFHRVYQAKRVGRDVIPAEIIDENFADGKKKGKSRPGRVKKSGASCKGSVSSLRAKAKKYSGEKGKMYHWCANMKGGKK